MFSSLPRALRDRLSALCVALFMVSLLPLAGCGSAANFVPIHQVATPTPVPSGTPAPVGDNYLSQILPARWNKAVVTFRVTGGDSNLPFVDMERTTRLGAELWNPALVGLVQVDSVEQDADVEITFAVPGTLNGGTGRTDTIGRTTITVSDSGIVESARVEIDRSLPPGLMSKVTTHEMGHALGCRGHSDQDGDVMYARANGVNVITARDRNTFRAIYGEDGTRSAAGPARTVVVCETTLSEIES